MVRLGLKIFSFSILLTYVAVPLISNQLGLSKVIYSSSVESTLIYENLALSLIPLCFLTFVPEHRSKSSIKKRSDLLLYLAVCYFFLLLFANFREANGSVQRLVNLLFPQAVLLSLFSSNAKSWMLYINVLFFSVCMIVADSRGLLIMSVFPLLLLKQRQTSTGLSVLKVIVLVVSGAFLFGLWGALREGSAILFSGLFRLSEPYWYYASKNLYSIGLDEVLMRLSWAITRINIFGLSGSIDGHDFYVEQILNIESKENVSLPITLIGQGRLWLGFSGAAIFIGMVSLLVVIIDKLLSRYAVGIGEYYSMYFVIKLVNIHAKSLSGAWSYIVYETIRDIIIFQLIYIISEYVFRRFH